MDFTRRQFLETTAAGALTAGAAFAGSAGPTPLPTRTFGRTGEKISILVMGCGSRLLSYKDDEAVAAVHKAIDLGVNYMDTAYSYGNGRSETIIGNALKGRKGVWVTTKMSARKGDELARIMEGSLKRLQRDQVDLVHIHALSGDEDLAEIEAKGGALERLLKLRDEKVTRFIGITCHAVPKTMKAALERHDFDCCQMALNATQGLMAPAKGGMKLTPASPESFEQLALPVAVRKKMGVIAMKVFGQEQLIGKAPVEKLIGYSLSLPVTAIVAGMPKMEFIDQNVAHIKAFKPMKKSEMRELSASLHEYKNALDTYFAHHVDA